MVESPKAIRIEMNYEGPPFGVLILQRCVIKNHQLEPTGPQNAEPESHDQTRRSGAL